MQHLLGPHATEHNDHCTLQRLEACLLLNSNKCSLALLTRRRQSRASAHQLRSAAFGSTTQARSPAARMIERDGQGHCLLTIAKADDAPVMSCSTHRSCPLLARLFWPVCTAPLRLCSALISISIHSRLVAKLQHHTVPRNVLSSVERTARVQYDSGDVLLAESTDGTGCV